MAQSRLGKMYTQQTKKEIERLTNELKDQGIITSKKGGKK